MFKTIVLLLLPISFLAANLNRDEAPLLEEELFRLGQVIEATTQSLKRLNGLKEAMVDYQVKLAYFLKNSEDKESALKVAKVATFILNEIKENFLTELFDPEFLSELTLFSQLEKKKGLVKPSSL